MKQILILCFCVLSGITFSTNVNAVLGLPENTARLGYSLGIAKLDIDDPDGFTNTSYTVQPYKLIYTDWWQNGNRYWLEAFHQQTTIKPSEKFIGQHVKHTGVNFLIQKNYQINADIRPWLGMGMGFSVEQYSKRHTIDKEGFLLEKYSDRKTKSIGVLLNLVNEWQVSKTSTIGGSLFQRISLNREITESLFSVYYLVRY